MNKKEVVRSYSGFSKQAGKFIHKDALINENTLASFTKFPVFMGCVDSTEEQDIFAPMLWQSQNLSVVVRPIIDSSLVYLNNHNEVVGATWQDHHKQFATFVNWHQRGGKIYEIGGAHGILSVYAKGTMNLDWLIHDINPCPVREYKGHIKRGKFQRNPEIARDYSTIVHSHTLEHVNAPWEFLVDVYKSQKIGDKHIFSIPNMNAMISRGDLNFLNFEHNYFLPISLVHSMLEALGYEIDDEIKFREHSIFVATTKTREQDLNTIKFDQEVAPDLIEKEFNSYFNTIEAQVMKINSALANFEGEAILFGAHVFSQMLIAMGLNLDKIRFCLDNSQAKNGKRLYGTNLKVIHPEEFLKDGEKQLIVGAVATYKEEILSQIISHNSKAEVLIF